MKASEALAKLRSIIRIEYYIGDKETKLIEDACADPVKKTVKKKD